MCPRSDTASDPTPAVSSQIGRLKYKVAYARHYYTSSTDTLPVILQAMKQEPPQGTKCKDKFLVQSVAITPDKDFANLASIVCSTLICIEHERFTNYTVVG